MYIHIYACMYVYIYIHIYINRCIFYFITIAGLTQPDVSTPEREHTHPETGRVSTLTNLLHVHCIKSYRNDTIHSTKKCHLAVRAYSQCARSAVALSTTMPLQTTQQ